MRKPENVTTKHLCISQQFLALPCSVISSICWKILDFFSWTIPFKHIYAAFLKWEIPLKNKSIEFQDFQKEFPFKKASHYWKIPHFNKSPMSFADFPASKKWFDVPGATVTLRANLGSSARSARCWDLKKLMICHPQGLVSMSQLGINVPKNWGIMSQWGI